MATKSSNQYRPVRTIGIFLLLTAAAFAVMAATNAWTPKLGLDLRGGTTITLTAQNQAGGGSVDAERLERARTIIQQRVDSLGVGEAEVTTSGERQIIVAVPNVQQEELIRLVGQTAELNFRAVYAVAASTVTTPTPEPTGGSPTSGPSASPTITQPTVAPSQAQSLAPQPTENRRAKPVPALPTAPPPSATPRPSTPAPVQPDLATRLAFQPSARDQEDFQIFNCGEELITPDLPDQPLITCLEGGGQKLLLGPVLLTGTQLTNAQAGIPQNQVNWVVNLEFNSQGAADFEKVTGELATRQEPGNSFAIVLDGTVITYPSLEKAIPGGRAEIRGNFTQKTATELANVLKYGALPLSFEISSVDTVSPTLGGDQLRAGIIAGLIGLGLVMIFAIAYYRGLAVVVIASLGMAALQTWAMMVLLGQSVGFALNLPAVAGAIVAIGVTADSFIIYFEKIRDEVREGRPLRSALETGWVRSRKTILVADSVSLLSAVVLFALAIGAVKGFAFTLGLTTIIDILMVFFFTKPLVTLLGRTKFFGEGHRWSGMSADHLGVTQDSLMGRRRTPIAARQKGA